MYGQMRRRQRWRWPTPTRSKQLETEEGVGAANKHTSPSLATSCSYHVAGSLSNWISEARSRSVMANRGQSWDAHVHSIADLREHGSKKLPKMYRDYYNEGAMDLITYATIVRIVN